MVIEISDVLLQGTNLESPIQVALPAPITIREVMIELGIQHMGYGTYFVNGQLKKLEDLVEDQDTLMVLPIFGGG